MCTVWRAPRSRESQDFPLLVRYPRSNMIESAKTSRKGGLSRTVRYECIVYGFFRTAVLIPN